MISLDDKLTWYFYKGDGSIENKRILSTKQECIWRTTHCIALCPGEIYFECKFEKSLNEKDSEVIFLGITTKNSKTEPGWEINSIGYELNETSDGYIYKDGKKFLSAPAVQSGDSRC